LLNNGYVVEMHGANYNKRDGGWELFNRVGTLNRGNSSNIDWSSNTRLGYIETVGGVGTDGTYLITTVARSTRLFYSWAIAP
jgi:hypothetical protein